MAEYTIKLTGRERDRLCALLNWGYENYWFSSNEEAKRFEEALDKFTSVKPDNRKEQK